MLVAAVGKRNTDHGRHGQARRGRDRRRHEPRRRRQAVRRRRFRRRASEVAGTSRPVPGGVGPMTIAMLLVNTRRSRGTEHTRPMHAIALIADSRHEQSQTNPLLDFSGLPRFDRDPAGACQRRPSSMLDQRRTVVRAWKRRRTRDARDMGQLRRAAGRRHRAPRPRLGRRRPPERRGRHARAARRLQREPAEGDRVLDRARPERALFDKYKALERGREFAAYAGARKQVSKTRCAISAWAAPNCTADKKQRFAEIQEQQAAARPRRSPRTCWTRPTTYALLRRTRSGAGRPARRRQAGRARGRRSRRQGRLEVHAALPVLLAGDAVCREPRAARNHLPRQRHPGLRTRHRVSQREWDNTPQHRRNPGAARRRSAACSATAISPRCRWCRRWRRRPHK